MPLDDNLPIVTYDEETEILLERLVTARSTSMLLDRIRNNPTEGREAIRDFSLLLIAAAVETVREETKPNGLPLTQCDRYTTDGNFLYDRATGEKIPPDEPIEILRARNRISVKLLEYWHSIVGDAASISAVAHALTRFRMFARDNPTRMRLPDTTRMHSN
jgi:hypothetical protein